MSLQQPHVICKRCEFYEGGLCKRYPPKSEFPKVKPDDWCGEFKER